MNIPFRPATLLLRPQSTGSDNQRHELILNIVLLSLLSLAVLLLISCAYSFMQGKPGYGSGLLLAVVIANLFLIAALAASRLGYHGLTAVWLIIILFTLTSYSVLTWGVLLPQAMLTFALIIVIAGILVNGRASLYVTFATTIVLFMIKSYESNGVITYNTEWMQTSGSYWDIVIYCVTLLVIAIISWSSNRMSDRMLQRSIVVEHELTKERNLLESKVADRTNALEAAQMENMLELHRFAEFGKLTSTLLHDVANPLTSVGLELEQMKGKQFSGAVERALEGLAYIEQYVNAARRQLRNESEVRDFNLADEIQNVVNMSQLKASRFDIALKLSIDNTIFLYGDPVRFNQISANLIANAIDSYDNCPDKKPSVVDISLCRTKEAVVLCVRDYGIGIDQESIRRVFEPFYTTKNSQRGTGIGLGITQQAVEQAFHGTISASSNRHQGTVFTVTIPLQQTLSACK